MTSVLVKDGSPKNRDEVMAELKMANIDSRPFFYPMSTLPIFEKKNSPTAALLSRQGINLPSGHNLTRQQIDYVCEVLRETQRG